jgi:hypothetical protein
MNPNNAKETEKPKAQERVEKPVKPSPAAKGKAVDAEIKPMKTDLDPGLHYDKGYVSEAGILFPKGYKFKGGSVSWKGNVVLSICPKCRTEISPSEAVKGVCTNVDNCDFNMLEELEAFKL